MEFQQSFSPEDNNSSQTETVSEREVQLGELFAVRKELSVVVGEDSKTRASLPHLPTFEEILDKSQELSKKEGRDEIFLRQQVRDDLNYNELYKQHIEISHPYFIKAVELLEEKFPWKFVFTSGNDKKRGNSVYFVDNEGHSQRLKTSLLGEEGLSGVVEPLNDLIVFQKNEVFQFEVRPPELRVQLEEKYGNTLVDFFTQENVSFEPREGWTVQEYCSNDFWEDQQSGEVVSQGKYVKSIVEDGVVIILCEQLRSQHTGHRVNSGIDIRD